MKDVFILVTFHDLADAIADLIHRFNASLVLAPEMKLVCSAIVPDKINTAICSSEFQVVTVDADDLLDHIDIGRRWDITE